MKWRPRLAWAAYLVVLWLALVAVPAAVPLDQLDASWLAMLAHDWQAGLQAGVASVFTYGPLGYLLTPTALFDADLFASKLVATLLAMLCVAALWTALVRRLPTAGTRILAALLVLGLTPVLVDNVYLGAILAAVTLFLAGEVSVLRALPVCAVLGVVGLVKFTNLPPALAGVLAMVLVAWRRRSAGAALAIATAYGTATVVAWLAAGQPLDGMGAWLQQSIQIAAGYQDVMGKSGPALQLLVGASSALALLALCAAAALARPRGLVAAVLATFVAIVTLVAWKAGFVRHDEGHAPLYFGIAAVTPLALRLARPPASSRWWRAGLWSAVALALAGLEADRSHGQPGLAATFLGSWQRLSRTVAALASPRQFAADQAILARAYAADTRLDATRQALGDGAIDAFGHEQGILLVNGFRIVHRPVFQSYSAYTPELQEINAACYESPHGPDHVLFKLQPVDDYFPTVADSQAFLSLLCGYRPELVERGFLLLRRAAEPKRRADVPMPVVLDRRAALDEWVELTGLPGAVHLLQLDLGYSLLGSLEGLLLRPSRMLLEVRLEDGRQLGFRIAPRVARTPFLLDPFVQGTEAVLALYGGGPLPRVTAFRVTGPRGKSLRLAREVGVRVRSAGDLGRAMLTPEQFERLDRGFYGMFHARPVRVTAPFPPEAVRVGGTEVLTAHAPAEVCFRLQPGSYVVSGGFGIRDEAWTGDIRTDGVAFLVVCRTGSQDREAFQRLLQPVERAADRGIQRFRVEVEVAGESLLVLGTRPGPRGDLDMDWSYWTDVRIEPR